MDKEPMIETMLNTEQGNMYIFEYAYVGERFGEEIRTIKTCVFAKDMESAFNLFTSCKHHRLKLKSVIESDMCELIVEYQGEHD